MRKGKRLRQPQRRSYDPASQPKPRRIVASTGEARVGRETRQLRRQRERQAGA